MSPCLELARDIARASSVKFFAGRKEFPISRDLDPLSTEVFVDLSLENSLEGCATSRGCWEPRFIPLLFGCRLDSLD